MLFVEAWQFIVAHPAVTCAIPATTSVALAGAALILALVGIQYYWQQPPTVEEIEEIDAALLTSDLPINAYLDKSFDTWIKRSQH